MRGGGGSDGGRDLLAPRCLAAAASAAAALLDALDHGSRIGESTVASTRVHILHPTDPDTVTVLIDRDAGRLFYGRRQPGQILHMDVFHSPGAMPPSAVAAAFGEALASYRRQLPGAGDRVSADDFDVQTAAGGGRLGGELRGGRRPGVLAAHRGHVHLAGRLAPPDGPFCFFLVAAVERALAARGLPPRKPLRVLAAKAGRSLAADSLRDYESLTDSLLREEADGGSAGERRTAGGSGRSPAGDARAGSGPHGGPPAEAGTPPDAWLAQAARLADEFGGADAVRALLEALAAPSALGDLPPRGWSPAAARAALARLVQEGWAEGSGSLWRLTARGQGMRGLFAQHVREVELALRAAARALSPGAGANRPGGGSAGRPGPRQARGALPPEPGVRWDEVAAPETAVAAIRRRVAGPAAACPAAGGTGDAGRVRRVLPEDLRVRRRVRRRQVDLCLLLDASASMEGGRMRAAKTLARHLVLTGRGRVAVMTFQERACALAVPLTRNYAAAERGLRHISPAGLTPLGAGLRAARRYLGRARAKNPLLLLVTDGIPTAADEGSPLDEALCEAELLRAARISLCCIGLEPNERYLGDLVRRAGGRLHVLEELRPDALARLAREERARLEGDRASAPRRACALEPPPSDGAVPGQRLRDAPDPSGAVAFANRG